MKTINKKSILLSFVLSTSLLASTYEYPQLYKDTKIMGMGGANIAVGGQASSIFYNSAGISSIPKENGLEVDLFNFNIALSSNILDFADDMDKANSDDKTDSEKTSATLDVTEDYLGKNLNVSTNIVLLSVAKKMDKYAFAIIPITGLYINSKTHRGSGADGIFEINGLSYGGAALGVSRDIQSRYIYGYNISDISLGVGLKYIKYKTINANLSVSELIDDNLNDYFEERYTKDGTSVVLDLGLKAKVYENTTAGVSIQNIGSIASENDISKIPMTVALGLAYTKKFNRVYFNQYQIALDYTDLFMAYNDNDFVKRTRVGISVNAFDGWLGTLGVQTGLYQGHPTFGVNLRMSVLKLAYTIYSEEIGAYSGQDTDKRHMVQLSLGW